jgi:hypothetical protein
MSNVFLFPGSRELVSRAKGAGIAVAIRAERSGLSPDRARELSESARTLVLRGKRSAAAAVEACGRVIRRESKDNGPQAA